jgi:hypothetical protein
MIRSLLLALISLTALAAPALAQGTDPAETVTEPAVTEPAVTEPASPAAPRTIIGSWEFSNADREKTCSIAFRNDSNNVGKRVDFDPGCVRHFPFTKDIIAWQLNDNDFLRLLDAQGSSILEFSEVESGIFEAPRPGEGILFIQNASGLGPAPKTADQITGEWSIIRRTGRPICALSLTNTASGEEFAVRVQTGCDPIVNRFAPVTWQMDRGEVVLRAANGQSWRFEETEDGQWRRIPETSNPLLMIRK